LIIADDPHRSHPIAGVATANVSGGPGALFWIWVYGFVAMAIKFSEAVLGITFRETRGATVLSGPMYYLRDGLHSRWLAWTFALVAAVAALTTTPFTQPNSMALVLNSVVGIPKLASGITIAILTWLVIIGGIKSIGRAAEKLSPLKVGLYLAGGLIVIISNLARIPSVLSLIFERAFSLQSAAGGGLGILVAMRYGIARHLRKRGRLRHGCGRLRHGAKFTASAAGTQRDHRGLCRVVRDLVDQRDDDLVDRRLGIRTDKYRCCRRRFQLRDPGRRRLRRRLLRVSLWLHHPDRLGLLRRAVLRIHTWPESHDAVSVGFCLLIPFGAVSEVATVWAWGDLMNALQVFPNLLGVVGLSALAARIAREPVGGDVPGSVVRDPGSDDSRIQR